VHGRKDRRVSAHPNREREHRNKSEPRPLAQHADGKSDILQQAIEHRQAPLVAVAFLGLLNAAEFAPCGMARFFPSHAPSKIFFREHGQMRLNFGIEIAFESLFAEEAVQSRDNATEPLHLMLFPRR
jgi:hypothetical protein